MNSLRLRRTVWLFASIIAIVASLRCGSAEGDEISSVHVSSSLVVYDTVDKLIANSDAVVIGSFSGASREVVTPYRDTSDPAGVDPDNSSVGNAYHFNVEEYVFGDGPGSLEVYQWETVIVRTPSGDMVTAEPSERPVSAPGPLQRYLLFLRAHGSIPNVFTAPAQPGRFLLSEGTATPDVDLPLVLESFPPRPESEFLAAVRGAALSE